MGMLKSLGLPAKKAGAATSKAFRRLFGRVLPTGTGTGAGREGTAGNSDAPAALASFTGTDDNCDYDHSNGQGNRKTNQSTNHPTTHKDGHRDHDVNAASDTASTPSPPSTTPPNTTNPDQNPPANSKTMNPDTMAARRQIDANKENEPPRDVSLTEAMDHLTLAVDEKPGFVDSTETHPPPPDITDEDPIEAAEKKMHMRFTEEALDMARLALRTNETPVGCVLVRDGKVIARGMNATNVTRNGTRHAEFMALCALFSRPAPTGPKTTCLKPKSAKPTHNELDEPTETGSLDSREPDEGNEDGSKGHLYPYGQKEYPEPEVDPIIIRETILYVTVEPCIMCASLLRQLGIKKVYFGAVNDKFGGTGGVFSVHANSLPISPDGQTASAHPTPRPKQLPDGNWTLGVSYPPGGGDGGNLEPGYEIEGGWGRDDAVALLRRFYVQENGRAPVPRKKEGRAARLAAMMEDGEVPEVEEGDDSPSGDGPDLVELESARGNLKENTDPNQNSGGFQTPLDDVSMVSEISEDLMGRREDLKGFNKGCIR